MAKVLLISINDFNAEGLRSLSAVLKESGHQSYMLFLKRYGLFTSIGADTQEYDFVGIDRKGREFRYARGTAISDAEKALLLSLIKDIAPQIIGISVVTPIRRTAAAISSLIKNNFSIPIIWGGPDPTISAEECLTYCDFVCIGEAEKNIIDLASAIDAKQDLKKVDNLAFMEGGRCKRNPINPLITDLDSLPFKDIIPSNKFLIEDDQLVKNFNQVSYTRNYKYHVISSRGCPNNCSYCCGNWYKKLYSGQDYLRRRSVSHVIQELKAAKKIIDYKVVQFEDEVFSYDDDWLAEFKDAYKKEINLPFICNIFPSKDIEGRLIILKKAGLINVCLGLQSGSERINREVFNRAFSKDLFIITANLLKSMGIAYYVDVITFNPFEREEDLQTTLDVLKELPKPFALCVNKLYSPKGTKIYDMIENHRRITQADMIPESIFFYYSRLFWLARELNKNSLLPDYAQRIYYYLKYPLEILKMIYDQSHYAQRIYYYLKYPSEIPKMIKRKCIKSRPEIK